MLFIIDACFPFQLAPSTEAPTKAPTTSDQSTPKNEQNDAETSKAPSTTSDQSTPNNEQNNAETSKSMGMDVTTDVHTMTDADVTSSPDVADNGGNKVKRLELKFNIVNVDYSEELNDKESSKYIRITEDLARKVKYSMSYRNT